MWRMRVICQLMLALFLVAPMGAAAGEIITVDDDGPADYSNIQAAINDANAGDIVEVKPGTYTGPGNRDIDFLGKAITLRSTDPNDPNIVAATIVDSNGTDEEHHRGFYFHSGEDASSILEGFTITNGFHGNGGGIRCDGGSPTISKNLITGNQTKYDGDGGGGISCWGGASPVIVNNTISFNTCPPGGGGGGIRCYDAGSPIIMNNTISDNRANSGGGMSIHNSSPTVINCIFKGNSRNGVSASYHSDPIFIDCMFLGNSASQGGGISNSEGSLGLLNCRFVANSAQYRGGGIRSSRESSLTLANCIFSGNTAGEHGGGMYNHGYAGTVRVALANCTFTGNYAPAGNGLACDSYLQDYPSDVWISNCILYNGGNEIWNNDASTIAVSYSDVEGGQAGIYDPCVAVIWGQGNIETDPCFADPGYWDSNGTPGDANDDYWVDGDYHLVPGSPCIDAGDNNSLPADTADLDGDGNTTEPIPWDIEGNPRIVDGDNDGNSVVDMGAYEANYIEAAMKFTPQALNPGSGGRWVKAHFVLPEGFGIEDVDADRPAVVWPVGVSSDWINVFVNEDELVEVEAAFGRAAFCAEVPAERTLDVMGILYGTSGQSFYGTDTVKITNHVFEYLSGLASYWLEESCDQPEWCGGLDLDQDGTLDFVDLTLFEGCCIEAVAE